MRAAAGLLALLLPVQALACPMSLALYTEPMLGAELRFHAAAPWEQSGMVKHVMELALPDGRILWGEIGENMGISRDEGRLYWGCDRPGPDDAPLDEAQIAECQVWSGVVYALQGGKADFTPPPDGKAPESLILSDIGRQLRYAVMDGPEGEIWDQFTLSGCAE